MPRRRAQPKPLKFVPIERAFKPQIKILAKLDINGPVAPGIKFHLPAGQVGFIDEDVARVWQAKGYVEILEGTVKPVSPDELAELTSKDATISLGDNNG
jgi:hypothetical protein